MWSKQILPRPPCSTSSAPPDGSIDSPPGGRQRHEDALQHPSLRRAAGEVWRPLRGGVASLNGEGRRGGSRHEGRREGQCQTLPGAPARARLCSSGAPRSMPHAGGTVPSAPSCLIQARALVGKRRREAECAGWGGTERGGGGASAGGFDGRRSRLKGVGGGWRINSWAAAGGLEGIKTVAATRRVSAPHPFLQPRKERKKGEQRWFCGAGAQLVPARSVGWAAWERGCRG